ncbi:hypothetical protein APR09_005494 [Nocardia amikacinitolerans]|nr:hypothetical protein [Nocardia amikacinitolerans]
MSLAWPVSPVPLLGASRSRRACPPVRTGWARLRERGGVAERRCVAMRPARDADHPGCAWVRRRAVTQPVCRAVVHRAVRAEGLRGRRAWVHLPAVPQPAHRAVPRRPRRADAHRAHCAVPHRAHCAEIHRAPRAVALPAPCVAEPGASRAADLPARGVAAGRGSRARGAGARRDGVRRRGMGAPARSRRDGSGGRHRCRRGACGRCARCRPSRPDPGPSAARSPRRPRHRRAGNGGTCVRHLVRCSPPWDSAPTGRDLRAVACARADRHPPTNLAFRLCCPPAPSSTSMTDFANDNDSATEGQLGAKSNCRKAVSQFAVDR